MVTAADLDTFLLIERRVDVKGTRGGARARYEPAGEVWARVEELRASERVDATRMKGIRTTKLTMLHRPALSFRSRLIDEDQGRTFNVDGIQHDKRGNLTTVMATETP